jgi:spore germination cell wall hydrolase CwlJ-like protein
MWLSYTKYSRYVLGGALALVAVSLMSSELDLRASVARTTAPARLPIPRPPAAAQTAAAVVTAPQSFEALTPDQAVAANAKVPVSTAPNPPGRPFMLASASAGDRAAALSCLTTAVYYEAGNQGPAGEAAVAQVVLNRLRSALFPKTVCGVVFEGSELKTGCQFTFTCDGSLSRRPSPALWRSAREVAQRALNGSVQKSVGLATHYHTIWVVPYWQSSVTKVSQIGAHIFYRLPGGLGTPGAFTARYAGAETAPSVLRAIDPDGAPVRVELAEAPEPMVAAVEPAPQIVAPPTPPLTVPARSTEVAVAALPADFGAPKPSGYFGHQSAAQRLPIGSHF